MIERQQTISLFLLDGLIIKNAGFLIIYDYKEELNY